MLSIINLKLTQSQAHDFLQLIGEYRRLSKRYEPMSFACDKVRLEEMTALIVEAAMMGGETNSDDERCEHTVCQDVHNCDDCESCEFENHKE
jgi:hypothetical protein